jgi:hypothetical protein
MIDPLGGDVTLARSDPARWADSVKDPALWAAIYFGPMMPTLNLLPTELRAKVRKLWSDPPDPLDRGKPFILRSPFDLGVRVTYKQGESIAFARASGDPNGRGEWFFRVYNGGVSGIEPEPWLYQIVHQETGRSLAISDALALAGVAQPLAMADAASIDTLWHVYPVDPQGAEPRLSGYYYLQPHRADHKLISWYPGGPGLYLGDDHVAENPFEDGRGSRWKLDEVR